MEDAILHLLNLRQLVLGSMLGKSDIVPVVSLITDNVHLGFHALCTLLLSQPLNSLELLGDRVSSLVLNHLLFCVGDYIWPAEILFHAVSSSVD